MDETTIHVLGEPGRANPTKSDMWVCRGGPPDRPGVIFRYDPSRSGRVPVELLRGYWGYLQTDGYIGYQAVGERPGIGQLGCRAHARRTFVEVVKGTKGAPKTGVAQEVIDRIGQLYDLERRAVHDNLDRDGVVALREREAKPVLDNLKEFLDRREKTTPPRRLLRKAIGYTLHLWPRLTVYLQKGFLRLDNNLAENAIRPFAVGRKNWLYTCYS